MRCGTFILLTSRFANSIFRNKMTKSNKILIGVIGALVVIGFVLGVVGFINSLKQTGETSLALPDVGASVPADWYEHRLSNTHIILTKQETLPDIGVTEGYAYGEQISISVSPFDGDPQHPEDWSQLAWTEDEALVHEKSWTYVGGMQALRVRHEAGGASGGQLTWYLFADDRVYELSLYPYENSGNWEIFSGLVYRYADALEIPALFDTETAERMVKLYYYNQELDRDEFGNILCSRKGLVSVEREIPITQTPIQDTITLLLSSELTREERSQGIDTEYPLEGFSLTGALLKNGVLTLEFDDPNNKTVGGACRVGILWFQIEATAKQFPEVEQVRFLPEELFQP